MRMDNFSSSISGLPSSAGTTSTVAVSAGTKLGSVDTKAAAGTITVGGSGSGVASANNDISLTGKPHGFSGAVLSPKHARELTPSLCLAIASALAEQAYRKTAMPYTLWITEAWRVLGWAEPSAALFWEMATMYHTLFLAGRAYATDFHESASHTIPPILSCGSTSSMGSGTTHHTDRPMSFDKKKFSTSASAKELPVWLVGTFLLLHCEEMAYLRNLSGQPDEQRLESNFRNAAPTATPTTTTAGKVDFANLLKHPSLSPRARLHTEWNNDNSNCAAYLLRQLRKVLLLSAVSHNADAVRACMHLAAIPSPSPISPASSASANHRNNTAGGWNRYSTDEIRRQHDDEHGNVGLSVRLTMDDLERLHFLLQPASGGGIDDPPLKIGDFLWSSLYGPPVPPTASIPIGDVERELRRHLELELMMSGGKNDDDESTSNAPGTVTGTDMVDDETSGTSSAMANLTLESAAADRRDASERAKQPQQGYQKELTYMHLRGTTILLKPNSHETAPASSGASAASGEQHNLAGTLASAGRLHDLVISGCSDVHMYLLQPFEHVTIAGCTGCTIVVGSVAGLLHVVDCEKTTITTAARRILVSNSNDVQMYVFTPSPPLLVGDNRSVQFAPYNTYYDGLREDLLATGLAAAVVPENQSPYHGQARGEQQLHQPHDGAWPPLQCASNKWKQPIELSKLEIPQVPNSTSAGTSTAGGGAVSSPGSGSGGTGNGGASSPTNLNSPNSSSPGADDKAIAGGIAAGNGDNATLLTPILLPASEFHILFVPLESEAARQRREEEQTNQEHPHDESINANAVSSPSLGGSGAAIGGESQYCRWLAEVLQLSPFRLPVEYERRALAMADRMRNIQQAVQKNLTEEQKRRFEEELNRGFRDWLVTSGNLRQVLDLVHLERRGGV